MFVADTVAAGAIPDRRDPRHRAENRSQARSHFEMTPIGSPAYEVVAQARRRIRAARNAPFEPKVVERRVLRSVSRLRARARDDGMDQGRAWRARTVADERIATDPERFWDHFQSKTLPALYDHVMALGKGKPRAEDAPFFGELNVGPDAQRARVPAADRSGTDLVDGGAARGDLLQHASFLRRHGPLPRAAPVWRIRAA